MTQTAVTFCEDGIQQPESPAELCNDDTRDASQYKTDISHNAFITLKNRRVACEQAVKTTVQ